MESRNHLKKRGKIRKALIVGITKLDLNYEKLN